MPNRARFGFWLFKVSRKTFFVPLLCHWWRGSTECLLQLSLGKARPDVTVAGKRRKAGLSADGQKTSAATTESAALRLQGQENPAIIAWFVLGLLKMWQLEEKMVRGIFLTLCVETLLENSFPIKPTGDSLNVQLILCVRMYTHPAGCCTYTHTQRAVVLTYTPTGCLLYLHTHTSGCCTYTHTQRVVVLTNTPTVLLVVLTHTHHAACCIYTHTGLYCCIYTHLPHSHRAVCCSYTHSHGLFGVFTHTHRAPQFPPLHGGAPAPSRR